MGLSSSNKGHSGAACHAVFRSLEEVVVERSSRVEPSDQMQIIQRCQEYDPEVGRRFANGGWHYMMRPECLSYTWQRENVIASI